MEGFDLSCRAEGKSPRTIEWYVQFLRRFCSYFEKSGLPEAVDQVGKEDIRRFILYLQKEALNPRTGEHLSTVTVQADGYRSMYHSFDDRQRTTIPSVRPENKNIRAFPLDSYGLVSGGVIYYSS